MLPRKRITPGYEARIRRSRPPPALLVAGLARPLRRLCGSSNTSLPHPGRSCDPDGTFVYRGSNTGKSPPPARRDIKPQPKDTKGKGKETGRNPAPPAHPPQSPQPTKSKDRYLVTGANATPVSHHRRPTQLQAVVLHGAPTKYKPGQMRRWIEEDNQGSIKFLGTRWLLPEDRRTGKLASSLVIYLKDKIDINRGIRMGLPVVQERVSILVGNLR